MYNAVYNFCHEKAFKSTVKICLCDKHENTFLVSH